MRARRWRAGIGLLVAGAILSDCHGAAASEPLTRARALSRVQAVHPRVAAARAREARRRAQEAQADAARYPTLTVDIGVGPSLRAELVPGTAVASTRNRYGDVRLEDLSVVIGGRVSVLQPLYTFSKIDLAKDAARRGALAERARTDMTRAELALEVARLYEAYLFARDAFRFFEETGAWLERTILDVRDQLEAGRPGVVEQDLLRLQTSRAMALLAKHESAAGFAQTSAALGALLGLPEEEPLSVAEEELRPIEAELGRLETLLARARAERPELRALRHARAARLRLSDAARAAYYPDIFAMVFVAGAYTPGRDLVDTRFVIDPAHHVTPGLFIGARWELQGPLADRRAREQRALADETAALQRWAERGLPAEVRKAYAEAERARRDLPTAREAAVRARQWMVQASADYNIGLGDSAEVSAAVESYGRLNAALMDARYRHNVALAELSHATGQLASGRSNLYPGAPHPERREGASR